MHHRFAGGWLTATALLCGSTAASAHVVAGARVFPVTLPIDDPGVAAEVSLPALNYDFGFEYDKTITPNTALIFNDGYDVPKINGAKTQAGFENLFITGKWQAYTNAEHEFVISLGIIRELGGTGTSHTGGDKYGSTAPTGYFGKGLGDLPIGFARPLCRRRQKAEANRAGRPSPEHEQRAFHVRHRGPVQQWQQQRMVGRAIVSV